jgi:hypothetical protein
MLEVKNAPSPDALPHLLLTGIAAGVRKKKAKVDLGMERAEAKAKAMARATARAKAKAKATANPMAQARSPAGISIPMAPVVKETIASSHTMVHAAQTKSLQRQSNQFLTRSPI